MVPAQAVVPARAVAPGKVALDHVVGQERAGPSPEVVLGLVVDRGKVEVVGLNRVVDRGVVQTSGVVLGPVVDQGKEGSCRSKSWKVVQTSGAQFYFYRSKRFYRMRKVFFHFVVVRLWEIQ